MANTLTKIAELTGNSFIFSSIPNTFDDLVIYVSCRDLTSGGGFGQTIYMQFNQDGGTNYSGRWIEGNGSAAYTSSNSNQTGFRLGVVNSTGATSSSIFGNYQIYIPNYTSSVFKSFVSQYVTENNATGAYAGQTGGTWRSTAAINYISMGTGFSLDTLNTATLYGVKKS